MPELPNVTRARLLAQGLSERDADVLMAIDMGREVGFDGELGQGAVSFFDNVSANRDPKVVVNWYVESVLQRTCHLLFNLLRLGLRMSYLGSWQFDMKPSRRTSCLRGSWAN